MAQDRQVEPDPLQDQPVVSRSRSAPARSHSGASCSTARPSATGCPRRLLASEEMKKILADSGSRRSTTSWRRSATARPRCSRCWASSPTPPCTRGNVDDGRPAKAAPRQDGRGGRAHPGRRRPHGALRQVLQPGAGRRPSWASSPGARPHRARARLSHRGPQRARRSGGSRSKGDGAEQASAKRPVKIAVYIGRDRPGLLAEITAAISSRHGNNHQGRDSPSRRPARDQPLRDRGRRLRQLQGGHAGHPRGCGRRQRRARARPLTAPTADPPHPVSVHDPPGVRAPRRGRAAGAAAPLREPCPTSRWSSRTGPTNTRARWASAARDAVRALPRRRHHAPRLRLWQPAAGNDPHLPGPHRGGLRGRGGMGRPGARCW